MSKWDYLLRSYLIKNLILTCPPYTIDQFILVYHENSQKCFNCLEAFYEIQKRQFSCKVNFAWRNTKDTTENSMKFLFITSVLGLQHKIWYIYLKKYEPLSPWDPLLFSKLALSEGEWWQSRYCMFLKYVVINKNSI